MFYTRNEAQEQHSLLDTILKYIFDFGTSGKHLYSNPQNPLHVIGFLYLFMNVFLEVQNKIYSQILYLIDYVVPGLHFW